MVPGCLPCRGSWKYQLFHSPYGPCCPGTGWSQHYGSYQQKKHTNLVKRWPKHSTNPWNPSEPVNHRASLECVREFLYLAQRVVVSGDLRVRVDVLQVPAERFTLKLLSQSSARRDVTVVHFGHTWHIQTSCLYKHIYQARSCTSIQALVSHQLLISVK